MTKICRLVDVLIEEVQMLIDMLVMPISDYDSALGVNWLTKYQVAIDYPRMKLSFESGGKQLNHTLVNLRLRSMPTKEL